MSNDSKFLRLKCKKCNNQQVVFNKASTHVKCLVCGNALAEPRGGKSVIKTQVVEVLGK